MSVCVCVCGGVYSIRGVESSREKEDAKVTYSSTTCIKK
jgi:hypothetical protein